MDPVYKAGLVLIAACPGGSASNLITHLLKGRTALSVSMTAVNSVIILITLPLITELGLRLFTSNDESFKLPFKETTISILLTVVLPVIIGVIINHAFPKFTKFMNKPMKYLMPAVLLISFAYVFFRTQQGEAPLKISDLFPLYLPAFLLNILGMFAGYYSAHVMKLYREDRYTLAVEVGLQNSALAIVIATSILHNDKLAVLAIVYGSFSFFTTAGMAWLMKKFAERKRSGIKA